MPEMHGLNEALCELTVDDVDASCLSVFWDCDDGRYANLWGYVNGTGDADVDAQQQQQFDDVVDVEN
eukprot:jgi/Hompol1/6328/HPOL_002250-RA